MVKQLLLNIQCTVVECDAGVSICSAHRSLQGLEREPGTWQAWNICVLSK